MPDPSSSPSEEVTLPKQRPTIVRLVVLAFLATAAGSAYLTRYCISVANEEIQQELSVSPVQMGYVFSAFSLGYFLFQVPGGWLGSRFGTRGVLTALSVLWSGVTLWTASAMSFIPLLASRVVFGLAQAGLVPNSAKVVTDWFPQQRRGISSALIASSMSVGAIITMMLTARLMQTYHWRTIFYAYSSVGIVWAIAFYAFFRTRPEQHSQVNEAELNVIRGESRSDEAAQARSETSMGDALDGMIRCKNFWIICFQEFFRAGGYGLYVTWMPYFLSKGHGVALEDTGWMTATMLGAVAVGSLVGGFVVDLLFRLTGSSRISRAGTAFVVLSINGMLTLAATRAGSVNGMVTLMMCGAFFFGMGSPAVWSTVIDVAGKYSAVVMGVMNMSGTASGITIPVILGYLIAYIERTNGDWNLVIYFIAAVYAIGAVCWLMIDPVETLERAQQRNEKRVEAQA